MKYIDAAQCTRSAYTYYPNATKIFCCGLKSTSTTVLCVRANKKRERTFVIFDKENDRQNEDKIIPETNINIRIESLLKTNRHTHMQ